MEESISNSRPKITNGVEEKANDHVKKSPDQRSLLNEEVVQEEVDPDTLCGFGSWTPKWLQFFASKKSYVLLHGLIGLISLATGTYFIATITTLEKRFKIPSSTSGMFTSALDVGALVCIFILSYLGSKGHKTRWISVGKIIGGLSCFIIVAPHFLYGSGEEALRLTMEHGGVNNSQLHESRNNSAVRASICGSSPEFEDCSTGSGGLNLPTFLLFLGMVIFGGGSSTYFTLGVAYMDDNVKKTKAPIIIAVSQCIRMLGPTLGFALASYSLSIYVDPDLTPLIDNKDPRWIGAWWYAWVPIGCISIFLALFLLLFPRQLPRTAKRRAEMKIKPQVSKKSFADFRKTMKRLISNKVLAYNTFSAVLYLMGLTGYWTFMPKYMETQFRQTASKASLVTGSVGLVFTAMGLMTSALVIYRYKPEPRTIAGWNVFVELMDVIGHFSWAFIGCPPDPLQGSWSDSGSWNLTEPCNVGCSCGPEVKYAPVCALGGGATFYSACHAGCSMASSINGSIMYSNCSCIPGSGIAEDGACPVDCGNNFMIFIGLQCFLRFIGSSGRAGNTLIHFRCVDEVDKSMAMALTEVILCLVAFIPGPMIYGLLLDRACMVWGHTCGKTGNCWLYDGQTVRYFLNFTAAACMLCGTLLDIGVWYHVKGMKIYDDKDDDEKKSHTKRAQDSEIEQLKN